MKRRIHGFEQPWSAEPSDRAYLRTNEEAGQPGLGFLIAGLCMALLYGSIVTVWIAVQRGWF